MLDKLPSGMSHSAVGHSSLLMNQLYVFSNASLNRNTDKTRLCIDQLTKITNTSLQEPNSVFPLEAMFQYSLFGNFTEHKYRK